MERSDLRVVKTRRVIRDALFKLMSEKELSKITVSELCVCAEINRKTFYRHYRTIPDVIEELEGEILDEFAEIMRTSGGSVLDVGAVIRDISLIVMRRRDFFVSIMKRNSDLFGNGRIKEALRRTLMAALKKVGTITDERTLRAVSEFTVSGVLSLYAAWFDGGCEGDTDFLTEVSVKMVTSGLTAFISEDKLSEMQLK